MGTGLGILSGPSPAESQFWDVDGGGAYARLWQRVG